MFSAGPLRDRALEARRSVDKQRLPPDPDDPCLRIGVEVEASREGHVVNAAKGNCGKVARLAAIEREPLFDDATCVAAAERLRGTGSKGSIFESRLFRNQTGNKIVVELLKLTPGNDSSTISVGSITCGIFHASDGGNITSHSAYL